MSHPSCEVVVITGGASGIGLECAKRSAARGASIALVDLDSGAAEAALSELRGGPHLAVTADVSDAESVRRAVQTVATQIGAPTAVVASAGIVSAASLRDVTPGEFRRVFSVNVEGVHNAIAAAAPHLIEAGERGSVVALSSVAAYTGGGLMGSGLYAASKAAVVGLVRGYARELAPWRVRVNAVAPAASETPMTSSLSNEERDRMAAMSLLGRLSRVEEIAATVVFLLGPDAGSITGQVIHPNGGVYFN